MSVKETIIEIIRKEGYDFFTAAEIATKAIKEFMASNKPTETYHIGHTSFTLKSNHDTRLQKSQ